MERTLPQLMGTARLSDGEAAGVEAVPAAAGALGGAGVPRPGTEEPGRRPPWPLPLRGGAVLGGSVARSPGGAAAAEVRAPCLPPRQVSPASPLPSPPLRRR